MSKVPKDPKGRRLYKARYDRNYREINPASSRPLGLQRYQLSSAELEAAERIGQTDGGYALYEVVKVKEVTKEVQVDAQGRRLFKVYGGPNRGKLGVKRSALTYSQKYGNPRERYVRIGSDSEGNGVYVEPKKPAPKRKKAKAPAKPRLPKTIEQTIEAIKKDPELNEGITMLSERAPEMNDETRLTLSGIALHEPSRRFLEDNLDRIWADDKLPQRVDELVIGAGYHAAVYCAVRVAKGYPKPTVIDAGRVGGAFGVSKDPSFYLNSRNRPGGLGIPGRDEALNILPGAPVQPCDLSGDEYQRNTDMAFAIRTSLAMNARVVTGWRVTLTSGNTVYLEDSERKETRTLQAKRIVWASGLGEASMPDGVAKHEKVLTFNEFMARLDQPFPFRGMERVAVVGSGDSGKTVIEALIGQGPNTAGSIASLDYVENIDWYGMNESSLYRGGWENCNRSRYKGIGRALPRDSVVNGDNRGARIRPYSERAGQINGGFDGAYINGRRYDHVVWATGFEKKPGTSPYSAEEYGAVADGERLLGRLIRGTQEQPREIIVGPAAEIPVDAYERAAFPADVPENTVAMFRYADRTATLAARLDTPRS